MFQLQIFQTLKPSLKEKPQPKTPQPSQKPKIPTAKRLTSFKAEVKAVFQSDPKPAFYGSCPTCGELANISLFFTPVKTYGWATDPVWLAANPPRSKGGAA